MAFPGIAIPDLAVVEVIGPAVEALHQSSSPERALAKQLAAALLPAHRNSFLTTLRNQPIKARLEFSREAVNDPQVVVMMVNSRKLVATLGDEVGVYEYETLATASLTDMVDDQGGAVVPLAAIPAGIALPRGLVQIEDEVAVYEVNAGVMTLVYRGIAETAAEAHPGGELATFQKVVRHLGQDELCAVRVDVLSQDAALNANLATIVKALLLRNRDVLELNYGLTLRVPDESSMAPRPISWPAQLLSRTLSMDVHRRFAVPEDMPLVLGVETTLNLTGVDGHATHDGIL